MKRTDKPVSFRRHRAKCMVCRHEKLAQIETDFIAWRSPAAMVIEYGLEDRASIYRHAHAANLFDRRKRNIRAALENILERSADVDVTASAVVAAAVAYAKINASGQYIDRTESLNVNDLFDKMSPRELGQYAADGTLPTWFPKIQAYSTAGNPDSNTEAHEND